MDAETGKSRRFLSGTVCFGALSSSQLRLENYCRKGSGALSPTALIALLVRARVSQLDQTWRKDNQLSSIVTYADLLRNEKCIETQIQTNRIGRRQPYLR